MQQLQLTKVHEYTKARDGSRPVLTRVSPATRLGRRINEDVPGIYVFIQGGLFFSEGGKPIKNKDLPDWLDDEIAKMTKAARKECGLPDDWKPGWKPFQGPPGSQDDEDD